MELQTMTVTVEAIADQLKSGQLEEARKNLEAVVETEENRLDLLFLRGHLQERCYEREAALATYEQVLEEQPDHAEACFRAALLCDMFGDDDRAIELYEVCTNRDPAPVNAMINLSTLYEECGRLEDAERCLQCVLSKYPDHHRADCYMKSVQSSYTMRYDEQSQRDREQHSAVLDTPVTDFELSVRSRNCLRQMNIRTLGDLLRTTEAELLTYKNFGETSLSEIKAMLEQKSLSLGQPLQPVEQSVEVVEQPVVPTFAPVSPELGAIMDRSISELELSVRARRCLQLLGVTMVQELVKLSEAELMNAKNFGQTSLAEIKQQLARFGLSFRE